MTISDSSRSSITYVAYLTLTMNY